MTAGLAAAGGNASVDAADLAARPVGPRRNIVVGMASWTDPSLIKTKAFYPKGCSSSEARLRYYASQFPMVEVDSSFFAMPSAANAALWAERTPEDFRFNVKAFRIFTGHQTAPNVFPRDIQEALPPLTGRKKNWYYADLPREIVDELWIRFKASLAPLRDAGKLRAVHFQFAPWVTGAPEWRAHVEECVARTPEFRLAVEFRNKTWFQEGRAEQTLAWEQALGVTHVIVDEPQGISNYAHGVWAVTTSDLALVRLHGNNSETWGAKGLSAASERFNYEYPDDELEEIARRTVAVASNALDVQVVVNVNHEDQGIRAGRRLARFLASSTVR
jgi:uncharacterized protein YecE (DUF72 family)